MSDYDEGFSRDSMGPYMREAYDYGFEIAVYNRVNFKHVVEDGKMKKLLKIAYRKLKNEKGVTEWINKNFDDVKYNDEVQLQADKLHEYFYQGFIEGKEYTLQKMTDTDYYNHLEDI